MKTLGFSIEPQAIHMVLPALMVGAMATLVSFLTGRDGVAAGWRLFPKNRHEWVVLGFHALESLFFCVTLAMLGSADAFYLWLGTGALLFIGAALVSPHPNHFGRRALILLGVLAFGWLFLARPPRY